MRPLVPWALVGVLAGAGLVSGWGCAASGPSEPVVMWHVPDSGRLPQAVIDDAGTVHLVYFQGEPNGGDLLYVTRTSRRRDLVRTPAGEQRTGHGGGR